ncbi:hypothetical protein P7K49_002642 [Saguinus oedipus]|uniref:Uncharacterized protein n=1 Tax=Saguinus oedipus TaxID=9490 RepID=A0ABQ9WHX0_SAGOE|nr:hypothetical protein P7K49_002642 [Saguinus oedipus]
MRPWVDPPVPQNLTHSISNGGEGRRGQRYLLLCPLLRNEMMPGTLETLPPVAATLTLVHRLMEALQLDRPSLLEPAGEGFDLFYHLKPGDFAGELEGRWVMVAVGTGKRRFPSMGRDKEQGQAAQGPPGGGGQLNALEQGARKPESQPDAKRPCHVLGPLPSPFAQPHSGLGLHNAHHRHAERRGPQPWHAALSSSLALAPATQEASRPASSLRPPRCGVPDPPDGLSAHNRQKRFVLSGGRWEKTDLTYR